MYIGGFLGTEIRGQIISDMTDQRQPESPTVTAEWHLSVFLT